MIDVAIWLLRWTLAGVALSAIVVAAVYALERIGRVVPLMLFRAALIAALSAPMLALVPPVFTFTAPGTGYVEPDRLSPRFMEKRAAPPVVTADDRLTNEQSAPASDVLINGIAGAVLALWASGAAFAAISRQRSYRRLSRAFRDGAPFSGSVVECRLSADAPTPLVFGVLRPRMLAPADFRDWAHSEREAVLRHEAAHARRGDLVWAFVGDVVNVAYWWAPPVRFLVSQHLLATEEACDSASLAAGQHRHDYARALIAVARRVGGQSPPPGLAMTASSLRRRIERLTSRDRRATSGLPVLAAGAAAAVMLALSAPAAAGLTPYRIYIFDSADGTSTYALSDGERATGAVFETCVGRLLPNAAAVIDGLEARIHDGRKDGLTVVWAPGPGSKTDIGPCAPKEPRDGDTLVLITDAPKRQARRFIRQIEARPRFPQQEMAADLGLD